MSDAQSRAWRRGVVHDLPDTGDYTTCCGRLIADLPPKDTASADHSEVTCVGAE